MTRKKALLLALVLALLAALAALAIPAGRQLKTWRAEQLARQAASLREQGELKEAQDKALTAYQMRQHNPHVIREMALTLGANKRPETLVMWHNLHLQGFAQPEDYRHWAEDAFTFNDLKAAEQAAAGLPLDDRASLDDWLLHQKIQRLLGKIPEATQLARLAQQRFPDDLRTHLRLAEALLIEPNPHNLEEALFLLQPLRHKLDIVGLEANRLLCLSPEVPAAEKKQAAQTLRNHPLARTMDQLFGASIEMNLRGQDTATILGGIVNQFRRKTPDDIAYAGRWLNQIGQTADTLALIDEGTAMARQDLFLIRADALALEKKWDLLENMLRMKGRVPLEEFHRLIFLSRALEELGRERESLSAWEQALMPGADLDRRLRYAGWYAETLRKYDRAARAYERMSLNPLTAEAGFVGLLRLAKAQGATARMVEILTTMQERLPGNEAVTNDLNYYRLVAGQSQQQAYDSALTLFNKTPNMLAYRVTLALGLLLADESGQAYEVLDIEDLAWHQLHARWQAVKIMTLFANGRDEEGRRMLTTLQIEDLLPEEFALLSRWMRASPGQPPAPIP